MALISNLKVGISANMKGLEKGLKRTKRKIKDFTKSVLNIKTGIAAALGVGSLGAVFKSSLGAWREQEQAVASLASTNESMGRSTAGITDSMMALASQLQNEGIIGDEAIIQGQSFLSTYSQIPDELLPRATRAMVDLMAKTGSSGKNAANLIGKASMGMAGALKIAGITLSDSTLKAIKLDNDLKKMADSAGINLRGITDNGKTFKLILADIESQIGGTNAALGKTDTGAFDQFSNAAGDRLEDLGSVISSSLAPIVRQLALDLGSVTVNAKELGTEFRKTIFSSLEAIAPFMDSLNGINLVWKTLKVGFAGFALAVIGQAKVMAKALQFLPGLLGIELISKDTIGFLDESFSKQSLKVAQLKTELGSVFDEVQNETLSKNLISKLNEFKKRAQATTDKLVEPIKPKSIQPSGKLEKLEINTNTNDLGVIMRQAPQIDRSNVLLQQILNKTSGVAVAS